MNTGRDVLERLLQRGNTGGGLFPQYRFVREENGLHLLGTGGFAFVYEMTDPRNETARFALKVMDATEEQSASFLENIRSQQHLSRLSPCVMPIVDVTEWEGLWCILMERREGILGKDAGGRMQVGREALCRRKGILEFAAQIGEAVRISHENGILHRDIKLENVYWNAEQYCYQLADFEPPGRGSWTRGYAAPEIAVRRRPDGPLRSAAYTVVSDIYSYGMMLYVLLNRLHFPGTEGYYSNMRQYDPDYVFPSPVDSSGMLTRSIRRMCEWDPGKRYQTMEEVLADLERIRRETDSPDTWNSNCISNENKV